MKNFAIVLLIVFVLILTGYKSKPKTPPPAPPVAQTQPVAPGGTGALENVQDLWFVKLLGQSADAVAKAQDSPMKAWRYTTTKQGYDYYFDAHRSCQYSFANNGGTLGTAKICLGVSAPLEYCLALEGKTPEDLLAELSALLSVEFEWVPNEAENSYYYSAQLEDSGKQYQIALYTGQDKGFDGTANFELTLLTENPAPSGETTLAF